MTDFHRRTMIGLTLAAPLVLSGAASASTNSDTYELPKEYLPEEVRLRTRLHEGEIHVDPNSFRLYWTLSGRKAMRYTVGVGRTGLYQPGTFTVGRKAKWPSWRPTNAMIAREPHHYARFANGMPGGRNNPLGARALYLYDENGRDTYLRIHGTNKPWTIASAVSNGCARLTNEHIAELYELVPIGTRVTLHPKRNPGT